MDELTTSWHIVNGLIDILFTFDILVNFNVATYDDDFELIRDRSTITWNYLTGWFFVDFMSILPIELFTPKGESSKLLRMSRLGRLQKIFKLLKLIRLIKLNKRSTLDFFDGLLKFFHLS